MLHHDDGIALVSNRDQHAKQPLQIGRVQPDRRLVEHVERGSQVATECCGELNALSLAAREGTDRAIDVEISKAYRVDRT